MKLKTLLLVSLLMGIMVPFVSASEPPGKVTEKEKTNVSTYVNQESDYDIITGYDDTKTVSIECFSYVHWRFGDGDVIVYLVSENQWEFGWIGPIESRVGTKFRCEYCLDSYCIPFE